uniref:hypothetical protein n=1 Tax=Crenothrix polyspora TaxID=360316 RepID=UPI0011781B20|nr:hypothetical protein [Crenothrix polyspora]
MTVLLSGYRAEMDFNRAHRHGIRQPKILSHWRVIAFVCGFDCFNAMDLTVDGYSIVGCCASFVRYWWILFQGQEESSAFYTKSHHLVKRHR